MQNWKEGDRELWRSNRTSHKGLLGIHTTLTGIVTVTGFGIWIVSVTWTGLGALAETLIGTEIWIGALAETLIGTGIWFGALAETLTGIWFGALEETSIGTGALEET